MLVEGAGPVVAERGRSTCRSSSTPGSAPSPRRCRRCSPVRACSPPARSRRRRRRTSTRSGWSACRSSCRRTWSRSSSPRRPDDRRHGGTAAWLDAVRRVAEHGCAPKLRCGGPRASDVPTSARGRGVRAGRRRDRQADSRCWVREVVRTRGTCGTASSTCWSAVARAAGGRGATGAGEHRRPGARRRGHRGLRAGQGGARLLLALRRRPRPPCPPRSSPPSGSSPDVPRTTARRGAARPPARVGTNWPANVDGGRSAAVPERDIRAPELPGQFPYNRSVLSLRRRTAPSDSRGGWAGAFGPRRGRGALGRRLGSVTVPRLAFLGPHATFTEQALLTLPEAQGAELVPCAGNPAVLAAIREGGPTPAACRSRTASRAPCRRCSTGCSTTRHW